MLLSVQSRTHPTESTKMAPYLLIGGLILLVLSGDALVRGAVAAAQRLHIPAIVIGLTIVALGTSAPELVVSIDAALSGAPGLAIGNVVGSNIANVLLVLGLPAIIAPMLITGAGVRRSVVFMIAVSFVLIGLAWDGTLTRLDGGLLITFLIGYLGYSGYAAHRARQAGAEILDAEELAANHMGVTQMALFIVFGIAGLAIGGKMTTDGALGVADMFGVSNSAVGLTIVALGTSLPELATSLAAAFRRQAGVVIGNVLGSNIINILGILGATALVVPLSVNTHILNIDIWVMLAVALAFLPLAFWTRRLNRYEGAAMTLAYAVYAVSVFL